MPHRCAFSRAADHSLELLELDEPTPAKSGGLTLGTVNRFQGGERSIVIFSSVVSRRASLAFLDARENRLNAAISRARHRLVVVGQRALLATRQRTQLLTRAAQPVVADAFRSQLGLYA